MTSATKDSPRRILSPAKAAIAFAVACCIGGAGYAFSAYESAPEPDRVVRIDNMVANIEGGSMVRLSLSVLVSPGSGDGMEEDLARDAVIGELRKVGKPDLDGYKGLEALREALLAGVRRAVGNGVKEVLIREFVVNG